MNAARAGKLIKKSPYQETIFFDDGGVKDIVEVIIKADSESGPFTKQLAKEFKGKTPKKLLENIWKFTRKNISYKLDKPGKEKIKSPGATWRDRYGDCKSMSIFIGSVLKNLGINYKYRVAFYDASRPEQGHIYPIALIDGEEIIVDAVNNKFNHEVAYWKAYDVKPENGQKVRVSGLAGSTSYSGIILAALLIYTLLK
jgi:hypothetical protein